jgi:phage anti-repressor protein
MNSATKGINMTTETKKALNAAELANFTGSENWYQHWLGKTLFTDGAKFVAEQAGAFWLVDEIAINQTRPKVMAEEFQVWTLNVDLEKRKAVLTCDDGNGNVVFKKRIEFTDFPLAEIRFYCTDNTILLPSEY